MASAPGRLVVFADCVYRRVEQAICAEQAFGVFLAALGEHVDALTIIGRLEDAPDVDGAVLHPLAPGFDFVALPHYRLDNPLAVARALPVTLWRLWRAVGDADALWLLGPHPHTLAAALIALARRRPLVLGVRQDYPAYVRNRRPGRRWMHVCADLLEAAWRRLARRHPVVVVGPQLAHAYRHAPAVHESTVSLITESDIAAGAAARGRSYDGELALLSVGRLDPEKNPLLLVDVLAALRARDPRWRLQVYGDGSLTGELAAALAARGLGAHAQLSGYLPLGEALLGAYRDSHAFLHVSLTEGMPQVLIEAFASGLPVIATDVGGVRAASGDAALLIAPADAQAAADALSRTVAEPGLREALIDAGLRQATAHTLAVESAAVATFIATEGTHA